MRPASAGGDAGKPRVGIGVLVVKDGKVLLGKRRGSHGAGEYASPGGHLEAGETFAQCCAREVREETGCEVGPPRFLRVMEVLAYAPKHYVDVAFVCDWVSGEPTAREPDKVDGWAWYALAALPAPLFATLPSAIAALQTQAARGGELAIYYGAAVRGAGGVAMADQIDMLSALGEVVTEHLAAPHTMDAAGDDAAVHAHDQALLARAHVMIADVTVPSTGTGYMIARAAARGVPVLAVHAAGARVSAMIAGAPDLEVAAYTGLAELAAAARAFLARHRDRFDRTRAPKVFLAGPPGSGKGTLGAALARETGMPHVSTGELLRTLVRERPDDPRAREVRRYMDAGKLVPARTMRDLVIARLAEPDCATFGVILDGYPPSRDDLDNLRAAGIEPDLVVYLDVSEATSIARQVGRAARATDTPEVAAKRYRVFRDADAGYDALAHGWYPHALVQRVAAERPAAEVLADVRAALRANFAGAGIQRRSYAVLPGGEPGASTRLHFHIDARDHDESRAIARDLHVRARAAQGRVKIYPIDALALGPQHAALPIYRQLPNFHAIPAGDGRREAFITGRLGDGDRALMTAALEVGRAHGAMVELEEYVGEWTVAYDGATLIPEVEYELTPRPHHLYPAFDAALCADLPTWELHHGFDLPKAGSPQRPPIALPDLVAQCARAGLTNGGWFLFAHDTHWAYRANEFATGDLGAAREQLFAQARALHALLDGAAPVGCSLERVHGIWVFGR